MSTFAQSRPERKIPPGRLWFAFAGGAAAWSTQIALCVFISSNACSAAGTVSLGGYSGAAVRTALAIVTLALIATSATAAVIAFRDWRSLAGNKASLKLAEAPGREEFMSLAGWIVGSLTTVGIFWASMPILLLNICTRAH